MSAYDDKVTELETELKYWKDKLKEIVEVGQEYSVSGANSHKMVSVDFIKEQITQAEENLYEYKYGLNGQSVVKS